MNIQNDTKVILTGLTLILIAGCSGPLPKSQSLLDAEAAYTKAKSDPDVLKYSSTQLKKADATLQAAAQAESGKNMNSLAYVANAQVQTAVETTETGKAIQKFKDLSQEKESLMAQSLQQEKTTLEKKLDTLEARETDRGLMYSLGDVLFVYGKADLQPGAEIPLNQLTEYMQQHPDKNMLIEGHTDNTGNASFNKKLSQQRADYVKSALVQRGIDTSRIKTIGLGQSQPIATNSTSEGRQKNRRVEVIIQD